MDNFFRCSMISTYLLVGCSADVLQDEHDQDASVESGELPSTRVAEASVRCDGTPLPTCTGPFTGATCELPCLDTSGEATAACGLDVYCHSDGTVYGLATRNAVLYRSAAGPLTIFRFSQTYDGLPVLAPDGIVTLVYGPQGAISASGAIVGNRVEYEHRHRQASEAKASRNRHRMLQDAVLAVPRRRVLVGS
jgi:hypothetical protein